MIHIVTRYPHDETRERSVAGECDVGLLPYDSRRPAILLITLATQIRTKTMHPVGPPERSHLNQLQRPTFPSAVPGKTSRAPESWMNRLPRNAPELHLWRPQPVDDHDVSPCCDVDIRARHLLEVCCDDDSVASYSAVIPFPPINRVSGP